MATQPESRFTLEQYLELEEQAEYKSEYHDGFIVAMSGGTSTHSRLSARMIALLERQLGERCSVYDTNLKLFVSAVNRAFYPDAMVACQQPVFQDPKETVLLNPTLVVEILSPSTETFDTGDKSSFYRRVPSLDHILLIAQDRLDVEYFSRIDAANWRSTRYTDPGASLPFVEISLRDIYRGILEFSRPD
jgi:Uma2 family endonuclease